MTGTNGRDRSWYPDATRLVATGGWKGSPHMRVVVVNSDHAMARLIRFVLSQSGHEAVLLSTAAEAERAIGESMPDAVLLDVELPDLDGCSLCRNIRDHDYAGPILVVSRRRDTKVKLRAFESGADDYVVEPFDPQELVARIDVVARRCRRYAIETSPTMLRVGAAELLISELTFRDSSGVEALLTPTEMRLLECLMRNVDTTVSRETLIERTWGYDFVGDSNRVEVYVARLRKKIETNPGEPRYLHTIRGLGYAFRVDDGADRPGSDIVSHAVGTHHRTPVNLIPHVHDHAVHERAALEN